MKGCSVFLLVVLAVIAGLALGLLLGWVVWPVQWIDASPENMRTSFQQDWVNMSIDSYSVNQNAALAAERFSYLGADGPKNLAFVLAKPVWVTEANAQAYAEAVGQAVAGGEIPTTTDETQASLSSRLLKPPLFGYVAVALFLALLAVILLVILVFRLLSGEKQAPQAAAEPEAIPAEAAVVTMDEAVEPTGEPEEAPAETDRTAAEVLAVGAVAAGVSSEADQSETVETTVAVETVPVEEQEGSRSGAVIGVLAAGAAVAGLMSGEEAQPVEEPPVEVEGQPLETTEVVRAVEAVAGEKAPFDGVVNTFQDAVQDSAAGGAGVVGAAALAGATAAGVGWALSEQADEEPVEPALEIETGLAAEVVTNAEWIPETPAEGASADETPFDELSTDFYGKYNRPVIEIEGIGETYTAHLAEVGITTTHALLQQCSTRKGREELANKTGISGKLILEWANHADMMRIQGIGPQWSDLLEMVGVNTVRELALRNPVNLHQKMTEVNEQKNLVRQLPTLIQVEDWIEQAKDLPRILTY
jgi:hypothetical protein